MDLTAARHLLDSLFIQAPQAQPGDHVHPLTAPIDVLDSGLYVLWSMRGEREHRAGTSSRPSAGGATRCWTALGRNTVTARRRLPPGTSGDAAAGVRCRGHGVLRPGERPEREHHHHHQDLRATTATRRSTTSPSVIASPANRRSCRPTPGHRSRPAIHRSASPPPSPHGERPRQMCSWADLPNDAAHERHRVREHQHHGGLEETATVRLAGTEPRHRPGDVASPAGGSRALSGCATTGRVVMERSWSVTGDRPPCLWTAWRQAPYSPLLSTADRIYGW